MSLVASIVASAILLGSAVAMNEVGCRELDAGDLMKGQGQRSCHGCAASQTDASVGGAFLVINGITSDGGSCFDGELSENPEDPIPPCESSPCNISGQLCFLYLGPPPTNPAPLYFQTTATYPGWLPWSSDHLEVNVNRVIPCTQWSFGGQIDQSIKNYFNIKVNSTASSSGPFEFDLTYNCSWCE